MWAFKNNLSSYILTNVTFIPQMLLYSNMWVECFCGKETRTTRQFNKQNSKSYSSSAGQLSQSHEQKECTPLKKKKNIWRNVFPHEDIHIRCLVLSKNGIAKLSTSTTEHLIRKCLSRTSNHYTHLLQQIHDHKDHVSHNIVLVLFIIVL